MKTIKNIFEFLFIVYLANCIMFGTLQILLAFYKYSLLFTPLQKLFCAACVAAILFLIIAVEYAFQAHKCKKVILEIDQCKDTPPVLEQVFSSNLKSEVKELVKD